MLQTEGLSALFKGLSPSLIGIMPTRYIIIQYTHLVLHIICFPLYVLLTIDTVRFHGYIH